MPGHLDIDLPAGIAWQLETAGPDTWSAPISIPADAARRGSVIRVSLLPAGTVVGKVEPPPRQPAPALGDLEVRFGPAPGATSKALPQHATVRCPVDQGRFRCAVPAGALDVRLKAAGFVPIYRWGVEVAAGKARDLGAIVLKRGTTLVGHVETDGSAAVSASCRVRLAPQRAGGTPSQASTSDLAAAQRLGELGRQARANDRGFFEFDDVAAGTYSVTASQEGFVEARAFPIEVREGLETEIRNPLVLARAVSFEVVLDPPVDPYGQRWKLQLIGSHEPMEAPASERHEGRAAADGRWIETGVAPGKYFLWVSGKDGARWASRDVAIWPGRPPLLVDLPVVQVRGTVTLGDDPLAGTLWLGGQNGAESLRFEVDAKGHFEGLLPREGNWPIEVAPKSGGVHRIVLDPVEVKKLPGARFATVEIHVPDTRLEGEVVDEDGHPLAKALLQVARMGQNPDFFATDDDGKFSVRGVKPGPFAIQAELAPRRTGWVRTSMQEGHDGPRLHLVAREEIEIRGQVNSPQGPVGGARIVAWPSVVGSWAADIENAISDPAGQFSIRVPAVAGNVSLLVLAPGYALHMLSMAAGPHAPPIAIAVEAAGASLIVPEDGLLVHGGTFLPVGMLSLWLRMNGMPEGAKPVRVPNVEAGSYMFCPPGDGAASLIRGGPPLSGSCTAGVVQPYGELSLLPPAPAATR